MQPQQRSQDSPKRGVECAGEVVVCEVDAGDLRKEPQATPNRTRKLVSGDVEVSQEGHQADAVIKPSCESVRTTPHLGVMARRVSDLQRCALGSFGRVSQAHTSTPKQGSVPGTKGGLTCCQTSPDMSAAACGIWGLAELLQTCCGPASLKPSGSNSAICFKCEWHVHMYAL